MVDMPSCSVSSRETSRAENPNCFAADFTLPLPSSLGERVSFDFLYPLQEIMNELKYYNCMNFRF